MVTLDNEDSGCPDLLRARGLRLAKPASIQAALAAEQKKLENGKSTTFEVLRLQRDLTTASHAMKCGQWPTFRGDEHPLPRRGSTGPPRGEDRGPLDRDLFVVRLQPVDSLRFATSGTSSGGNRVQSLNFFLLSLGPEVAPQLSADVP